jgi:hypothetical protein
MKSFTIVTLALALAACATSPSDSTTASNPREEKEYRIGSRIPVHDSSGTSSSPTSTGNASIINPALPPKM